MITISVGVGFFLLSKDRTFVDVGDKYAIFKDLLVVLIALVIGSGLSIYGILSRNLEAKAESLWQSQEKKLLSTAQELEIVAFDRTARRAAYLLYSSAYSFWNLCEAMYHLPINTEQVRKELVTRARDLTVASMGQVENIKSPDDDDRRFARNTKLALAHYLAELQEQRERAYALIESIRPEQEDPRTAKDWNWFETKAYILRRLPLQTEDIEKANQIVDALLSRTDIISEEKKRMRKRHSIEESPGLAEE